MSWGLSLGLSKTLMVPGGSYSNNLPSPLTVHLQLCLRTATPPGHHSCHNSDTFLPLPAHAMSALCIPKLLRRLWVTQCTPLGCPFSQHHLEIGKKKEFLLRTRRKTRSSGCWRCALTFPSTNPQKGGHRELGSSSAWQLCPCHARASWGLLRASGGHALNTNLSQHRIAQDAPKPLLISRASSRRGTSCQAGRPV